jgi:hypothetical protein
MDPTVPSAPRPAGERATSLPPFPQRAAPDAAPSGIVPGSSEAAAPGGVPHSASEADVPMTSKVGGPLTQQSPPRRPQHHNPHGAVNYARVAHEEMHAEMEHPVQPSLRPGHSGVVEWDKASLLLWL